VDLLPLDDLMSVDEIFEQLIQSVTDVQIPIGVRWTVVQDESLGVASCRIGG
jgi:hypothetical protein